MNNNIYVSSNKNNNNNTWAREINLTFSSEMEQFVDMFIQLLDSFKPIWTVNFAEDFSFSFQKMFL